jgi:hypothetical protein
MGGWAGRTGVWAGGSGLVVAVAVAFAGGSGIFHHRFAPRIITPVCLSFLPPCSCIPVIIQDNVHLGFESIFDFDSFAIRIAEKDMARVPEILTVLTPADIEAKQRGLAALWRRCAERGQALADCVRGRGVCAGGLALGSGGAAGRGAGAAPAQPLVAPLKAACLNPRCSGSRIRDTRATAA